MQACDISIITTVDGEKSSFSCKGNMELSVCGAQLFYSEPNASVKVVLDKETAKVIRQGDYSLALPLQRGAMTVGTLGIGGNEGEIQVYAYKIEYSIRENAVMAILHYDLLMGEGRQEMKLRIVARANDKEQV